MALRLRNWSGNLGYRARALHEPTSVAEVQAVVRKTSCLRVLGTRHCFNAIADCEELMSLSKMKEVSIDPAAARVTVQGGITYSELCPLLHEKGLALHNLASLPHISVCGAIATATHGSGQGCGNLGSAVCGLQLVLASGELLELNDTEPERLQQAVVGLGCLGVVTAVSLRLQPAYFVRQRCYEGLHLGAISSQADFDAILGAAYSVSVWTNWLPPGPSMEFRVWVKDRLASASDPGGHSSGGALCEALSSSPLRSCVECREKQHCLKGFDPTACTEQGIPGPWHERLPHFAADHLPNAGNELQSEYFVARRDASEALRTLAAVSSCFLHLLMVTEIRVVASDGLLLSPHSRELVGDDGAVGFHFTWQPKEEEVLSVALPAIEAALECFRARPHWGKLFVMQRQRLEVLYGPALASFRALAQRLDPSGKFCNPWVRQTLGDYRSRPSAL